MRSPATACSFSAVYSEGLFMPSWGHKWMAWAAENEHPSQKLAIFFCDFPDKFKYTNEAGKELALQSATMTVSVRYDTWLGWLNIPRQPAPTTFTFIKYIQRLSVGKGHADKIACWLAKYQSHQGKGRRKVETSSLPGLTWQSIVPEIFLDGCARSSPRMTRGVTPQPPSPPAPAAPRAWPACGSPSSSRRSARGCRPRRR